MTAILTDLCKTWPKRLKRSPSPQRRSWWRTPTAARSLSASPWCLCRSRCHRASTYSTSPGVDKELDKHLATGWRSRRCLAATGCSLSLIQEHANKRSLKLIVPLLNLSPGRPRNISLKSRWDLLHINFTKDLLKMGILYIDRKLILTLLLFHSHVDNLKTSVKVDCKETRVGSAWAKRTCKVSAP